MSTMINQDANSQVENSTSEVWQIIEKLQNELASVLRRHEAGKDVDGLRILSYVRSTIEKALLLTQNEPPTDVSIDDLLQGYWVQVEQRSDCAPTGFKTLNDMLGGGFESKRLVVVLGAPNSGKTTFVHQIADHIADSGRPVLYVTSEDIPHDLFSKTLARIGNVHYTAVQKGWEAERAKITMALALQSQRVSTKRLRYLDASRGISLDIIREKARAHFEQYSNKGQGIIIVDYLQRIARAIRAMGSFSFELREAVTVLTEQLRALACELDCCVVAIASQNRASGYTTNTSSLASAKESGDIEYTADVIMALGDDSERKPMKSFTKSLLLRIDKNRQGDKDKKIGLDFQPDRQLFTEVMKSSVT